MSFMSFICHVYVVFMSFAKYFFCYNILNYNSLNNTLCHMSLDSQFSNLLFQVSMISQLPLSEILCCLFFAYSLFSFSQALRDSYF